MKAFGCGRVWLGNGLAGGDAVTDAPLESTSLDGECDNPFAVSSAVATSSVIDAATTEGEARVVAEEETTPSLSWVIGRWTLVCGISAVPSFIWGLASIAQYQGMAMIFGVATFVVAYVWWDLRSVARAWRRNPRLVFVLRIGYWTRIVCSIIFPVGMLLDLWCGMLAFSAMASIWEIVLGGMWRSGAGGLSPQQQQSFLFCYLMTLLQGLLLNVVLAGYMLIVAGVIAVVSALRRLN